MTGDEGSWRLSSMNPAAIASPTRARRRIPRRLWKNLLCDSARLLGRFIGSPLGQRVRGRDEIRLHGFVEVALVKPLQLELRDVHQTAQIRDLAQEGAGAVETAGDRNLDRILGEVRGRLGVARLEEQKMHARFLSRDRHLAKKAGHFLLRRQKLLRHLPALVQELELLLEL